MSLDILMINDDRSSLTLLKIVLERENCTVVTAMDGEEGLAILEEMFPLPDLIICDDRMPGMTGIEVLEYIRNSPECGGIPFLLTTMLSDYSELCSEITEFIQLRFWTHDMFFEKIEKLLF